MGVVGVFARVITIVCIGISPSKLSAQDYYSCDDCELLLIEMPGYRGLLLASKSTLDDREGVAADVITPLEVSAEALEHELGQNRNYEFETFLELTSDQEGMKYEGWLLGSSYYSGLSVDILKYRRMIDRRDAGVRNDQDQPVVYRVAHPDFSDVLEFRKLDEAELREFAHTERLDRRLQEALQRNQDERRLHKAENLVARLAENRQAEYPESLEVVHHTQMPRLYLWGAFGDISEDDEGQAIAIVNMQDVRNARSSGPSTFVYRYDSSAQAFEVIEDAEELFGGFSSRIRTWERRRGRYVVLRYRRRFEITLPGPLGLGTTKSRYDFIKTVDLDPDPELGLHHGEIVRTESEESDLVDLLETAVQSFLPPLRFVEAQDYYYSADLERYRRQLKQAIVDDFSARLGLPQLYGELERAAQD